MKASRLASSLLLFCGLSCGGSPGRAVLPTEGATNLPIAPLSGAAPVARCAEPTITNAQRNEGVTAFMEGRPEEAVRLLEAAVKQNPRDRAATFFLTWSRYKLSTVQAEAGEELVALPRVTLAPIPLSYVLQRSVAGAPTTKVRLEKVSEAKNLITDVDDWYQKNALTRSQIRGASRTPSHVPISIREIPIRNVFLHRDHAAADYGGIIVASAPGKRPLVFDATSALARAPRPFEIGFAQLVGSTLVVQFAYNGYAKESGGKNGYLAAYDAPSGELLWASDPLVSNAGDAVVSGGSIITGYGFTAEPDFLFAIDLATGKVEQKIAVKSGPEIIQAKNDRLFVRTYETDYVFKSATGFPPAQGADLMNAARSAVAPMNPEQACWVRRAAESIAARDTVGLREASLVLEKHSNDRVLHALLLNATKMSAEGRIDLTAAPLVVASAPPWSATPATSTASGAAPKLVKVSSASASPTRGTVVGPRLPLFIAPIDKGALPGGVREDIASSYGLEDLRAIIPDQEKGAARYILIYGGRYVALVDGSRAERVFDLDAFRHPPKADPRWKEFAEQDATYAQERDGVLYVCNGGGSYAKEVFGKKGFVSAIEVASGKLLWRSAPLTCNATFAVAGDHLITGYGFTEEPDFVFLLRRSDGAIVQKVPIASGPNTITLDGSRVHVESYSDVTELELR